MNIPDFGTFCVQALEIFLGIIAVLGGVGLGIGLMAVVISAGMRLAEWLADR